MATESGSASGSEPGAETVSQPAKESFWRRLLNGWMAIVARFGFVQTLLLLLLIYVFLIGPVSIVMAILRTDQLSKRGLGEDGSAWCEADTAPPDLERAKTLS